MTNAQQTTSPQLWQRVVVTTKHGVVTGSFAGDVRDRGSHHVMILGDDGAWHTYAAHTIKVAVEV